MWKKFATYLRSMEFKLLVPMAIMLAMAPFYPHSHLMEKLGMLAQGTLHRPIDIFDLFMHSAGLILVLAKTVVYFMDRKISQG